MAVGAKGVDEAISANPDAAGKIRDAKVKAAGVLIGAIMKATKGHADAQAYETDCSPTLVE